MGLGLKLLCGLEVRHLPGVQGDSGATGGHELVSNLCPAACGVQGVGRCAGRATGTPESTSAGRRAPVEAVEVPLAVEPHEGVSNVVFSLVRSDDDMEVFFERSRCLARSLAGGPRYDQVVFHEGPLSEPSSRKLLRRLPSVHLVDAKTFGGFALPPGTSLPSESAYGMPDASDGQSSLGYRHMCRFMSMLWFRPLVKYELVRHARRHRRRKAPTSRAPVANPTAMPDATPLRLPHPADSPRRSQS